MHPLLPDPMINSLRNTTAITACLLACGAQAQAPVWTAPVDPVARPGLHAIALEPALVGNAEADLRDLRLWDAAGKEVPYRLRTDAEQRDTAAFRPYTLLANNVVGKRSIVELEVPAGDTLRELVLRIRSAQVDKALRITGSDDRAQWFMVKDTRLHIRGAEGPGSELRIDLPSTDRRYLRLELNDSLTAPVQVAAVGRYAYGSVLGRLLRDTGFQYSRRDSAGTTTLTVLGDRHYVLDRLVFLINDTLPYSRNAELISWYTNNSGRGRKRRSTRTESVQASFIISKSNAGEVLLPGLRVDSFAIRIFNGDDRPLAITEVQAYQHARVLEAFLDPSEQYRLVGLPDARAPRYDTSPFQANAFPVATLAHGALTHTARITEAPLFDPAAYWIWAVVIALSLGMGYMAMRMLRKGNADREQ